MKLVEIFDEEREKKLYNALDSLYKQFDPKQEQKQKQIRLANKQRAKEWEVANSDVTQYISDHNISTEEYKLEPHYKDMVLKYGEDVIARVLNKIELDKKASKPMSTTRNNNSNNQDRLIKFLKKYKKDIRYEIISVQAARKTVKITMPRVILSKVDDDFIIDLADQSVYHLGGNIIHKEFNGDSVTLTVNVYIN